MITNHLKLPLLALAAVITLPIGALAQSNNLNAQAKQVQTFSYQVKNEIQTHYKGNGAYKHMRTDIDAIIKKANHIEFATRKSSIENDHMIKHLGDIDREVNHLGELVRDVNAGKYGRVEHGLQHVITKIDSMDYAINSMERSVRRTSTAPAHNCDHDHGAVTQAPVYNPAPVYTPTPVRKVSSWDRFLTWLGLKTDNHHDHAGHNHTFSSN